LNDQALWEETASSVDSWYSALPANVRDELDGLIAEIMLLKQKLVDLATAAGSAEICRACGGECCLLGKYHFSVLDLLAYRKSGLDPVVPAFNNGPACPYSDSAGCLMLPCYRPATCVIFNCQLIEDRLSPDMRAALDRNEKALRDVLKLACRTSGTRIDRPLLLSVD
jgi:hypothetical protein